MPICLSLYLSINNVATTFTYVQLSASEATIFPFYLNSATMSYECIPPTHTTTLEVRSERRRSLLSKKTARGQSTQYVPVLRCWQYSSELSSLSLRKNGFPLLVFLSSYLSISLSGIVTVQLPQFDPSYSWGLQAIYPSPSRYFMRVRTKRESTKGCLVPQFESGQSVRGSGRVKNNSTGKLLRDFALSFVRPDMLRTWLRSTETRSSQCISSWLVLVLSQIQQQRNSKYRKQEGLLLVQELRQFCCSIS